MSCRTTCRLPGSGCEASPISPTWNFPELLAAIGIVEFEQFSVMLAAWKPSLPPAERAGIIASMVAEATDAQTRLVGLQLLGMFDTDVAEPHMRQLLDTDAAGHAAIWLMGDLAEADAVGDFVTPAIMVDILSPGWSIIRTCSASSSSRMRSTSDAGVLLAPPPAGDDAVLDVLGQHLP